MIDDTKKLLAHVRQCSLAQVMAYPDAPLTEVQQQHYHDLLARLDAGEPYAYLVGEQEFWSLPFAVNSHVLIPRPETEHLVEWVLQQDVKKIADLGTGSGCIAIAIAKEKPDWRITATDFSGKALEVARENAKSNSVQNIVFQQGNWCKALIDTDYDLIVSNPPYIEVGDSYLPALKFEPITALVAEQSGLADLHTIIQQAKLHLKPGGKIALEHGYNQSEAVRELLQQSGYSGIESHCDYAGHERFSVSCLAKG